MAIISFDEYEMYNLLTQLKKAAKAFDDCHMPDPMRLHLKLPTDTAYMNYCEQLLVVAKKLNTIIEQDTVYIQKIVDNFIDLDQKIATELGTCLSEEEMATAKEKAIEDAKREYMSRTIDLKAIGGSDSIAIGGSR